MWYLWSHHHLRIKYGLHSILLPLPICFPNIQRQTLGFVSVYHNEKRHYMQNLLKWFLYEISLFFLRKQTDKLVKHRRVELFRVIYCHQNLNCWKSTQRSTEHILVCSITFSDFCTQTQSKVMRTSPVLSLYVCNAMSEVWNLCVTPYFFLCAFSIHIPAFPMINSGHPVTDSIPWLRLRSTLLTPSQGVTVQSNTYPTMGCSPSLFPIIIKKHDGWR